jgi:Ca2+-binding RTX toxin-like protein
MVTYIRSDLNFILQQIKIAEAHARWIADPEDPDGKALFGPGGSIPTYNIAWGLRTVDGSWNNPLHPTWGSADHGFPSLLDPNYRPATVMDMNGPAPGGQTAANYNPSNNPGNIVVDPSLRTTSNLLVDQTPANIAAVLSALARGDVPPEEHLDAAVAVSTPFRLLEKADVAHAVVDAQTARVAAAQAALAADPGNPDLIAKLADAEARLLTAQNAAAVADGNVANYDPDPSDAIPAIGAQAAYDQAMALYGLATDENNNLDLPNTAPDEGLSAPFNSWFTLFGQFFDHGLDLVAKGNSGTVFVPLSPDDPLYDPNSNTNFMVLTRATTSPGVDGLWNTADDIKPQNITTSFVDQNQTYTSHPSHQVFLREYVLNAQGIPEATGRLLEGQNGGLATWGDIKKQAKEVLGIDLTDYHVGNLPLLATDPYGNFIPDEDTGFPQVVMLPLPGTLQSGTPGAPLVLVSVGVDGSDADLAPDVTHLAARTGHAFLDDIAHTAVPIGKVSDGDQEIGLGNFDPNQVYDQALLDAHFATGDGRGNENIGLTAVHHVFHSEHNRLLQHTKDVAIADAQAALAGGATQAQAVAFLNEWLDVPVATVPTTPAAIAALDWNGERLFQAAKFGTEMQYQHLVFEEFARKIQPNINVFLVPDGFDVTIDPTIVAEFAHVVYRFGHSMLTETIDRFDPNFNPDHIGLIEGFLNPIEFASIPADEMAGSIIRGMTRQVGNQIDEFVTSALRNNLLGLPLDLATINLARGRDTGVPSLNAARRDFFEATNGDAQLKPYESWVEFAGALKNEASIINFIAAYGTHSLITTETTIEGKRDAALTLIFGVPTGKFAADPAFVMPTDAEAFLNGTGAYGFAGAYGGLENVDLWIGGLAEAIMPFGGMLGSTFNFVFETQMEKLQNGDRFYYLQRLDGLHLFGEMEANSFAAMIMRNTDATHLPSDVFSTPGLILEVDRTRQYNPGLGEDAGLDGIMEDDPLTLAIDESADNRGLDPTGGGILTKVVVRNNPATVGEDNNYLKYTGGEHVLLGGTEAADILIAGIGDDTLYGDGGNDNLEGGHGNDIINAGAGDDIVRDMGGDDNIKGGDGNDVVHAGPGLDLVMGGRGQDFIVLGTDMGSEVFAGEGNDFILGNKNAERILGNEGDDWLETGTFDGAPGDNFDEIFAHDSIDGHDVFLGDGGFDEFIGEGGDDIMVGSPGRGKMAGMSGFDWATYKDNVSGVNADLSIPIIFDEAPIPPANAALDEFESMEGLSGSRHNDILKGSNTLAEERVVGGSEGLAGSYLDADGIARVAGLQAVLGTGVTFYNAGDIILGGDGSDLIQGNAGDDIIDGDKWLNVQISIRTTVGPDGGTGAELARASSMTSPVTLMIGTTPVTKPLTAWMLDGTINPGQLAIVREITTAGADAIADIDTAVFQGGRGEYAFSAAADGQVIVTHAVEDSLDGTDRLRNIEKAQFATGNALNIIVGTSGPDVLTGTAQDDLILGLDGADTINAGAGDDILVGGPGVALNGEYEDNFNTSSFGNTSGDTNWGPDWVETNDGTNTAGGGQIRIDDGNNILRFYGGTGGAFNGAEITRELNLAGASTVTITYDYDADNLDGGEQVRVMFAADGVNYVLLNTIDSNDNDDDHQHVLTGTFASTAKIRFEVTGINDGGENVEVDNLNITFSSVETLNGGAGNDTYSVTAGDGNDVINELANEGTADRISILAPNLLDGLGQPVIDPATGLPIPTMTSLTAFDDNTGTQNGALVITYAFQSGPAQTITVNNHFGGTNTQTGVERIGFNGAVLYGYLLGTGDYFISRSDPNNRDAGGVNLSAPATNNQQNFAVGENGVNDVITGGALNDLIFGGTGDNDLFGGLGDDLLVGGNGNGDDDLLDGGADADTMVGGNGNDTYVVDDLLDVVVELAGANTGTDTVETLMAELSIANMANVENLSYEGVDADQFIGTGNAGNNSISGGDLNDTLSGLAGNDTLDGGLGDDVMIGGAGNDTYIVDSAGDVVDESTGLAADVDTVESSVDYTLAAGVENLELNGAAVVGRGNAGVNTLSGNGDANQLFGAGGNDTLNGDDGDDLLDGGDGNDAINGGDDSDTIIGGAGNDTIDVGGDVNTIVYNASGFGDDVINSFDAAGGTAANQDKIDLSGLGITAANFATRVTEGTIGGTGNTLLTVRDAGGAVIGTIRVNNVTNANMDATDFTLAAAGNTITGTGTGQTHNGTAGVDTINGLGGNDTLNGQAGSDYLSGGTGNDTVNGGDGDDTVYWNANDVAPTDGMDIVNGGTEGGAGDLFVVNGNTSSETFRIYTRLEWDNITGNNGNNLAAATEIVITRNGTDFNSIIGQLAEIEEIRINGVDPSGAGSLPAGPDTFQLIGDFTNTSLRLNTVTITGSKGSDVVDISALTSDHRLVYTSNGGNDHVIGDLRPQDVVDFSALAADSTPAHYMHTAARFDFEAGPRVPAWKLSSSNDFIDLMAMQAFDHDWGI